MIEVRRITADEKTESDKVFTVAFNTRHDYSKEAGRGTNERPVDWTWATFEDGKIVSRMTEIPFMMRFDGNDAKMSGIGGVATLPEARKGGKIRQIYEKLLPEAYSKGVVFSSLAPFSHAFYRKFGYELCSPRIEIELPTINFAKYTHSGRFVQVFPGDDTSALQKVHTKYISNLNHAIRRDYWPDNVSWRHFTGKDPYSTGVYIYVWYDGAGEPRSYVKYLQEYMPQSPNRTKNRLNVDEVAFTDKEALFAAFSLFGSLNFPCREFFWAMPAFLDPSDFADVAWDVHQRVDPKDMTRVVNVKTAFELMRRPPCEEGAYIVETSDEYIRENTGRWLVEYGPGGSRVSRTQKDPDLICGLPVLAQLVTGYRTLDSVLQTSYSRVEVLGNENTLRKVFTLRPQHVTEFF